MHGNKEKYSSVPNGLLGAAAPTIGGRAATDDAKMAMHSNISTSGNLVADVAIGRWY